MPILPGCVEATGSTGANDASAVVCYAAMLAAHSPAGAVSPSRLSRTRIARLDGAPTVCERSALGA